MRVNHIGNIHGVGDAGLGEVLQVLGKIVLCRFARCGNVNVVTYQARTPLGVLDMRPLGSLRGAVQRKNLDLQLRIDGEHGPHGLRDVDVHAARIPATGLCKGVGVHRVHVNRSDCLGATHRRFPLYSTAQRPTRLVYRDRTFARREV